MRTQTKELLEQLTPEKAIELLKEGNQRFVNNLKFNRNLLQQVNETSQAQFPFAIVLSCIDSRTSAELIFDQGLGDIFSVRIAGNVVNDDILGSMEFACKVAGSKLVVVLGHTNCGAIKGACDNVQLGYLTGLLNKIKPAMQNLQYNGARNAANPEYVQMVAEQNAFNTMQEVLHKSDILRDMVKSGAIGITGGMYDVETGMVTFYDQSPQFQKLKEEELTTQA